MNITYIVSRKGCKDLHISNTLSNGRKVYFWTEGIIKEVSTGLEHRIYPGERVTFYPEGGFSTKEATFRKWVWRHRET